MFYPELINFLSSDTSIASTVTSYSDDAGSYPAIFSDEAPEDAVKPYIVVRIDSAKNNDSVIMESDVYVDYFDYDKSRVTADAAANHISDRLDTISITSENLTDIRFLLSSRGYIKGRDPRTIHHNSTFSTRAARSRWMRTLT